jgi:hypothetical protein
VQKLIEKESEGRRIKRVKNTTIQTKRGEEDKRGQDREESKRLRDEVSDSLGRRSKKWVQQSKGLKNRYILVAEICQYDVI